MILHVYSLTLLFVVISTMIFIVSFLLQVKSHQYKKLYWYRLFENARIFFPIQKTLMVLFDWKAQILFLISRKLSTWKLSCSFKYYCIFMSSLGHFASWRPQNHHGKGLAYMLDIAMHWLCVVTIWHKTSLTMTLKKFFSLSFLAFGIGMALSEYITQ